MCRRLVAEHLIIYPRPRRISKPKCKRSIYNYSDYQLSFMQIIALSKGFKFIPLGKRPHRSQILQDFHQLARKMRMIYIIRAKSKREKTLFKLPSAWDPRSSDNIESTLISSVFRPKTWSYFVGKIQTTVSRSAA